MATDKVARRLTAIFALDMVGYSRLIEADEEGTIARQMAHRNELINPKIAEHNGRVVKTTGDGMLVEFTSVVDAVRCAVDVQLATTEREADLPEDLRISYRVGVNLGDIVIEGDDILGDGVNVAARLEGLAEPGGICVSGKVFAEVRNKLDLGFAELGPQTVKNIAEPVPTYRVLFDPAAVGKVLPAARKRASLWRQRWAVAASVLAVVGAATWFAVTELGAPTRPGSSHQASIAVLPFTNLSGDAKQDYFSDGISEDIITALARFSGLLVIARNTTFRYKNKAVDVKKIGRELNVRYVLEGSVRRDGDRVRVTAQLIDTRSGAHLWTDRYDRKLEDIFAVQDDITGRIVGRMVAQVSRAEIERVRRKPPASFVAYDHYLRAAHLHRRVFTMRERGKPLLEARRQLELAVSKDPRFAQAYVLLAHNQFQAWIERPNFPPLDPEFRNTATLSKALSFAQKAIEIDGSLAEAHATFGFVLHWMKRHRDALEAYARAFALNPNLHDERYLTVLVLGGRPKEGVAYATRLIRVDPTYGRSYGLLGLAHYLQRDYAKAADALRSCKQFAAGWRACSAWRAAALAQLGRIEEAKAEAAENMRLNPGYTISRWVAQIGDTYARRADLEHFVEGLRKAGLPE